MFQNKCTVALAVWGTSSVLAAVRALVTRTILPVAGSICLQKAIKWA